MTLDVDESTLAVPGATSGATVFRNKLGLGRRALGIGMLMVTVFLWTACNFLASYIFSDDTYSKPFFVVYINTGFFAFSLVPMLIRNIWQYGFRATRLAAWDHWREIRQEIRDKVRSLVHFRWRRQRNQQGENDGFTRLLQEDTTAEQQRQHTASSRSSRSSLARRRRSGSSGVGAGAGAGAGTGAGSDTAEAEDVPILATDGESRHSDERDPRDRNNDTDDEEDDLEAGPVEAVGAVDVAGPSGPLSTGPEEQLNLRETAWLSLEFCMLWFLANYFAAACLQYTSVASATIFTSLSSMFTLLFCALARVERFSIRKLLGVVASLAGVALVSSVDLSGQSDEHRGQFPHKTPGEIAIGDTMALVSAVVYGAYVTVMKHRVGNEDRVNMPLFFGLVGLFNVVFLWPGFILLHVTGVETVEMPPSGRVWAVILINAFASLISDMSWAYAMLLTTPLVVTVGLSLTIPLSLIGEMIQYQQFSSAIYWVGAVIVVCSFLFVNHESHEPTEEEADTH